MGKQEGDEEDASRAPSLQGSDAQALIDFTFIEVCKHAAAKLGVQWTASPGAPWGERDLYKGTRLPLRLLPAKHLLG